MLRDFLSFLRALWAEWVVLLTGGSLIAISAIWAFSTGRAVPRNINWLLLGLTLVLAAFLAWRKEWIVGNRGFIDISPQQLSDIYQDRTSAQADALITPYIGKSIKFTSAYYDMSFVGPWVTFVHMRDSKHSGAIISFYIPFWKRKVFAAFPRGMLLTVTGRVRKVEAFSLSLSGVLLLKIEELPKLSTTH